jgi:hypothetical protein
MIGLDTNIIVLYLMQDDVKQAPLATRLTLIPVRRLRPDARGQ